MKLFLWPFIALIIILTVLCPAACTPSPERRSLETAEAVIEQDLDSAIAILNSIDTAAITSGGDRVLFDLLSNLASYKSFNDSLDGKALANAVDYYTTTNDDRRLTMALYLLGNQQNFTGRYAEAALSLTKGMDLAEKNADHFNEGKCAMSLCTVYSETYNATGQVASARRAISAFQRAEDKWWEYYAILKLTIAFNNNNDIDSAYVTADLLLDDPQAVGDTILMCDVLQAKGLSAIYLLKDSIAVTLYAKAIRLASDQISDGTQHFIAVLLNNLNPSKFSEADRITLKNYLDSCRRPTPFYVLAKNNRYKEAFEALEKYRLRQDSVLQQMMSSTVEATIEEYQLQKSQLAELALERTRIYWCVSIAVFLLLMLLIFMRARYMIKFRRLEEERLVSEIEALAGSLNRTSSQNEKLTQGIKEILSSKMLVVENMCVAYEQNYGNRRSQEIKKHLDDIFNNEDIHKQIVDTINRHSDGVIEKFRADFPKIKEDDVRLFIYHVLGLSASAISLILEEQKDVIYNRKSRLKSKIKKSGVADAAMYLSYLG